MNNKQLLVILNKALSDYKEYKELNVEDGKSKFAYGLCKYFDKTEAILFFVTLYLYDFRFKDDSSFMIGYINPYYPEYPDMTVTNFWFPLGLQGVDERINLLTEAIKHYSNE